MATARTFTAGHVALTLDGVACGFVDTLAGGDISADVIESAVGPTHVVEKHIGPPKYEEFVAQIGLSLAQPVYDWIAATLNASFARKNGAVTLADANLNAKGERQFTNALVTEIGFPALSAAAKDAARLTVKFAPELTRAASAGGKVATPAAAKAKLWTRGNFRLELDGVDCSHVKSIDAFTVQLATTTDAVGDTRDLQKEPGRLEIPNLSVTLADDAKAATWQSWFQDFVVNGDNASGKEKSGAIVYLAPDLKTELGRVVLHEVGICALRHSPWTNSDQMPTWTVELYCQRMELVVGKPAPAKPVVVDQPIKPAQPIVTPVRPIGIRR